MDIDNETTQIRRDLAKTARELVAADPHTAIQKFREHIQNYSDQGDAWITEPPVRVLATEINKTDDAGLIAEAEKLIEENENAQANALALATSYLTKKPLHTPST